MIEDDKNTGASRIKIECEHNETCGGTNIQQIDLQR